MFGRYTETKPRHLRPIEDVIAHPSERNEAIAAHAELKAKRQLRLARKAMRAGK